MEHNLIKRSVVAIIRKRYKMKVWTNDKLEKMMESEEHPFHHGKKERNLATIIIEAVKQIFGTSTYQGAEMGGGAGILSTHIGNSYRMVNFEGNKILSMRQHVTNHVTVHDDFLKTNLKKYLEIFKFIILDRLEVVDDQVAYFEGRLDVLTQEHGILIYVGDAENLKKFIKAFKVFHPIPSHLKQLLPTLTGIEYDFEGNNFTIFQKGIMEERMDDVEDIPIMDELDTEPSVTVDIAKIKSCSSKRSLKDLYVTLKLGDEWNQTRSLLKAKTHLIKILGL